MRRHLVPYLLLVVLTLGAGLAAGLSLAGAPITYAAPKADARAVAVTVHCRHSDPGIACTYVHRGQPPQGLGFDLQNKDTRHVDLDCLDRAVSRLEAKLVQRPGVSYIFNLVGVCGLPAR